MTDEQSKIFRLELTLDGHHHEPDCPCSIAMEYGPHGKPSRRFMRNRGTGSSFEPCTNHLKYYLAQNNDFEEMFSHDR